MWLFADDIVVVGRNEVDIRRAIIITEIWAKQFGMALNKKKSAVMTIFKSNSGKQGKYQLMGYPHVTKYKYLGTVVDQTLASSRALQKIHESSDIIRYKWSGICRVAEKWFSRQLFLEKIRPKFLAVSSLYSVSSPSAKEAISKDFRVTAKRFLGLPASVPNKVLSKLVGNIQQILIAHSQITSYRRRNPDFQDQEWVSRQRGKGKLIWRKTPRVLYSLITIQYSSLCKIHKSPLTNKHVDSQHREVHCVGLDLQQQIQRFQQEDPFGKRQIKKKIGTYLDKIKQLKI